MIGEREDGLDLVVDGGGEGEGIETVPQCQQRSDFGAIVPRGLLDALQRRPGGVVASAHPGADTVFALKLHRGEKEILE